jgi:DNA processing protein
VAFRIPASAWREIPGVDAAIAEGIVAARPSLMRQVDAEWEAAVRVNARIVSRVDAAYPTLLASLPDAPVVLQIKGSLPEGRVRVAMVGSRHATAYGERTARSLAGDLALYGIEIVSGGARGIDTFSHKGALAQEGVTVAVMGCGLSRTYPPENAKLFAQIAERGALVSEFPAGMEPLPENFPRRNRLISGLSAATIVVEAAAKSGSLITAGHALEQGREVMAVPGSVESKQSQGCNRLIQQGAKLVQSVQDVLDELSPMYRKVLFDAPPGDTDGTGAEAPAGPALEPDEAAVLALFTESGEIHVDRIAQCAPFGVGRLQAALFGLAFKGRIDPLPGGYYVARPQAASHGPSAR